jgi:hypothetical protein
MLPGGRGLALNVINFTFLGGGIETAVVTSGMYFRITAGTISRSADSEALAMYEAGRWKVGPWLFRGARFEGRCRLLFGIPRAPDSASEFFDSLTLDGRVMLANDVPYAAHDSERGLWYGIARPSSWVALRIVSADMVTDAVDVVSQASSLR